MVCPLLREAINEYNQSFRKAEDVDAGDESAPHGFDDGSDVPELEPLEGGEAGVSSQPPSRTSREDITEGSLVSGQLLVSGMHASLSSHLSDFDTRRICLKTSSPADAVTS